METSIRLRGTPPGAPNSALAGRGWRTHTGGIDTVRWHGYRGSMRGESEQQLVFADGAAVDSAGAFAERMPADVPVQHPQRAPAL